TQPARRLGRPRHRANGRNALTAGSDSVTVGRRRTKWLALIDRQAKSAHVRSTSCAAPGMQTRSCGQRRGHFTCLWFVEEHVESRMPGAQKEVTAIGLPRAGMPVMSASAEDIGLSFAILSLVFAGAALIRRWSRPLRTL